MRTGRRRGTACSTARRTVETLGGIREALPPTVRIELDETVYGAGSATLLRRLHLLDDDVGCAMVVGHNPGTQDLGLLLVGSGDLDMRTQLSTKLPTGAAVTLSFDGAWSDLSAGVAALDDLFMPRSPRS